MQQVVMTTVQTTHLQATRVQSSAFYTQHSRKCSRLPLSPAIALQTPTLDEKRPQNTVIAHALAGEGSFSGQQSRVSRNASRVKQRQEDSIQDIQATTAHAVVTRFFQHLNRRELGNLFSLLSPEVVYINNTLQAQYNGKPAVVKFYIDTLSSVPQGSQLVLEEVVVAAALEPPSHALQQRAAASGASSRRVSVAWHLEIGGVLVPGSEGIGLYRVDTETGLITELKDTPQAALQVLLPAMALATPVIDAMSPILLPALGQVSTRHHHVHGNTGSNSEAEQGPYESMLQPVSMIQGAAEFAAAAAGSLAGMLTGSRGGGSQPSSPTIMTPWAANWYGITAASMNTDNGFGLSGFGAPQSDLQQDRFVKRNDAQSADVRVTQQPTTQPQRPAYDIPMRPLSPERDVTSSEPTVTNRFSQTDMTQQFMYSDNGGNSQQSADTTQVQPATFSDIPDAPVDLSGVWEKDAVKSDAASYEKMMDVLGLSGLQRVTARLIEGVEINHAQDTFAVSFLTVVPFFKVTEKTKFGSEVRIMRRDLKPGQQTAITQQIANGVRISFKWGPPNAGSLTEEYVLVGTGPAGEMHVKSSIAVGDKSANVVQVYQRSGKDRDQLLKESRDRNNSLESVLERQKKQFGQ